MATNIHNLFHLTITFGIFAAFHSVFLRHFIRYFCSTSFGIFAVATAFTFYSRRFTSQVMDVSPFGIAFMREILRNEHK